MNRSLFTMVNFSYFSANLVERFKSMIKRILVILFVVLSIHAYSQQEEQYSHYMFVPTAYNPGYMGLGDEICVNGVHRQQWMGLEHTNSDGKTFSINPVTSFFSVDAAIHPIFGGVGINFKQDKLGAFTNTTVELGYSFHRNIGPGKIGIGVMGGLLDQTIDFTLFDPLDPQDPLLMGGGKEEQAMAFDMKFGAYYRVPGLWYAGISSSKLLQSEIGLPEKLAKPALSRHYYLTGGYVFRLAHPDFKIEPSAMIKSDLAATQYDLTALVWYMDRFYGGLTYRTTDAISVLVGLRGWDQEIGLPDNKGAFKSTGSMLGISYDLTTSPLGAEGRSAGTFEVFLRYCFDISIPPVLDGHRTVRFL